MTSAGGVVVFQGLGSLLLTAAVTVGSVSLDPCGVCGPPLHQWGDTSHAYPHRLCECELDLPLCW